MIICLGDSPDGYEGYKCKDYSQNCEISGDWYDRFRSACPVTCKKGKDISIPKKLLANIIWKVLLKVPR